MPFKLSKLFLEQYGNLLQETFSISIDYIQNTFKKKLSAFHGITVCEIWTRKLSI